MKAASVTILSSSPAVIPLVPEKTSSLKCKGVETMSFHESRLLISYVTKLTLEGRTDASDLSLQYISKFCVSLYHLNIEGCIYVTDIGVSDLISRCKNPNSIVVPGYQSKRGHNAPSSTSSSARRYRREVIGILLVLDQPEVSHLIKSPDALKAKIAKAMDVLRIISQQSNSPTDQLASLSFTSNLHCSKQNND
ncbi:hypothetical protein KIW84_011061 [Lathyrus oleraceus]|uniref:PABC domain-containing protein n=1 Tax=Pisum sativum TaxID=3888 RepID=A0A9D4YNJ2_PEA|nr:hypothetical protein KIW84_011060 [Pisum sativum]KAI5441858.1 hypothetical protein KIW84_011061 [Pisum sativum]